MAESTKSVNPLTAVGGVVGAAGGWALSQYAGAVLWVPGLATLVLLLLLSRPALRPKYFLGAIVVTGGHLVWFLVASVITQDWLAVALDLMILSIGLVWLWVRPGLAPALFLGLVQAGSLVLNLWLLASQAPGSLPHKALTVHCLWRLMAIICLVAGYVRVRRECLATESLAPVQEHPLQQ